MKIPIAAAAIATLAAAPAAATTVRVADAAALARAAAGAAPGDSIVLADGVWRDMPLTLSARGTPEHPVVVSAQTPGGVVLSGRAGLTIGGRDTVVTGVVFRDARSGGAALVAIDDTASGIVVRDIVVERTGRADRRDPDVWVALGGRANAVEGSRFVGKGNAGAVVLLGGRDNRVTGNHFLRRPVAGVAGGETIRVVPAAGGAAIERNLIEDCDGSVALIAVAGDTAAVRGNLILRSRGSIVVTGRGARVERNIVRGDGKAHSGGVVVGGTAAVVRDNYLERLAAPALAIAPDGDGDIVHNSVIDSARITFADGAGAVRFADNLIRITLDPFRFTGTPRRIILAGNRSSFDPPAPVARGVTRSTRDFVATPAGLLRLPDVDAGAAGDLSPIDRAAAGPRWHAAPTPPHGFEGGRLSDVAVGTLAAAIRGAAAGDTLHLADGTYRIDAPIRIDRPLTITGPARFVPAAPTLFQLDAGGSLRLVDLTISGAEAPARPGNAIVRAAASDGGTNYAVLLDSVTVRDLAAPGFDVVATTPGSFADRIDIRLSRFERISGAIVSAAATRGYRAALVRITGSKVSRTGRIADIARGDGDDGFGPAVELTDTQVTDSGAARLGNVGSAVIAGDAFVRSPGIDVTGHPPSATVTVRCNRPDTAIRVTPPVDAPRIAPDWRAAVACDFGR